METVALSGQTKAFLYIEYEDFRCLLRHKRCGYTLTLFFY